MNARDTSVPHTLSPLRRLKEEQQMQMYNEMIFPKRLQRQESDKLLLRSLFQAFGGTNKTQWHIVDPVMAAVFPKSFYKPV